MPKIRLFALAALATSLVASAAPLAGPTAVHTQPNAKAPVIKILMPGSEPAPVATPAPTLPAGWMAVQQSGPFVAYVRNGDIDKALNVKPGASIHLEPAADSGVLTTMGAGDKATITGLHGKWSQIKLEKTIVGYIHVASTGPVEGPAPAMTASQSTAAPTNPPAMSAHPPAQPDVMPVTSAGTVAPTVDQSGTGALPRFFQGKIASTRRPFTPRRPYDWQLNDNGGVRYAYLDLSRLLLTDQIENYAGHEVVVYGTPKAMPDGRNIVIQVESLRLQ